MRRAIPVLLALALLPVAAARSQEVGVRSEPFVSVRGEGKVRARPDVARLSASLVTRAASLDAASKAHGPRVRKSTDLLDGLKARGLTVRESGFTMRVERQGQPYPTSVERGAPPSQGVAITRYDLEVRPPERLDEVVSGLAESGLFEVGDVAYAVDDARGQLEQARKAAMADAIEQANLYAKEGGFTLGGIVAVLDGSANVVGAPQAMRAMSVGAPSVGATAPSTIDTDASVSVTWRIGGARPEGGR